MFGKILSLQWKSFLRSPAFSQNLATTIIMGIVGVYFALVFLGLGFIAPKIITDVAPEADGPIFFGRYFMYFLIYSFLTRLIFQNFGFADLRQYILQRVPKSTIFHFMLTKSALHWINIMTLLGIGAYLVSAHYDETFNFSLIRHGLVLVGLLYLTNYKAFLFDKQLSINKKLVGTIILIIAVVTFLDIKGYIPLGDGLEYIYGLLVSNIFLAMAPMIGAIVCYGWTYRTLQNVAYLEDEVGSTDATPITIGSGLWSRFGEAGEMMAVETKLILRNKRSKNMMYIVPLMAIYPLIIHGQGNDMGSMGWMMFVAIFCTGGYAITYGQLLLSWNSGHFDLLQTKMQSIKEIFKAKYYLQCVIVICQTLPMILWGFYKFEYFYLMPAMMFYVLGVVLFMYMLMASYNSKKVNTNAGAAMNYEGFSLGLFLIIIPIMLLPMALYYGFDALGHPMAGVFLTGLIGLVGFVFHDKLLDVSVALFKKNRYKIGAAFRSKS